MVDALFERTRRMSVDLRPLMLEELGLQPALRALVEGLVGSSGISFGFQSTGPTERLPPDIELACYRVAKEAVTNVVRHSEATRLVVRLERHPQKVDLVIRDDGKGFQPERVSGPHFTLEHLGLVAMRERARALGGSFSITPRRDRARRSC